MQHTLQRPSLCCVLCRILLFQPFQVEHFPPNGRKLSGARQSDQAEVRFCVVQRQQESRNVTRQTRAYVLVQLGLSRHHREFGVLPVPDCEP